MPPMPRRPSSASHERPSGKSGERESALDGTSRRSGRVGHARGRSALRLLYLLVVAVITVVCVGITSPGRGIASRPSAVELAGHGVHAARSAAMQFAPRTRQWRDGLERPAIFREAVEADVDDDDAHTRWGVAGAAPVALRGVPTARKPGRALRGEAQSDTSRFAIRRGFPRGPPA